MGLRLLVAKQEALLCVRSLTTSTVQRNNELAKTDEIVRCYSKLDLSFENTQEAYKSKTNKDIVRALAVLGICNINPLVKYNEKITSILRATLGRSLFKRLLKATFFGQFVAGENRKEIKAVAVRLKQYGVMPIFDYSAESDVASADEEEAEDLMPEVKAVTVITLHRITSWKRNALDNLFMKTVRTATSEVLNDVQCKIILLGSGTGLADAIKGVERQENQLSSNFSKLREQRNRAAHTRAYLYDGEENCDRNRDIILATVDAAATACGSEGFVAVKATGLGRPGLLLKLSDCITRSENIFKTICGTQKIQFSKISKEQLTARLKELGVKIDEKVVTDSLKSADIDKGGHLDYHDWSKIIDSQKKLGSMFQTSSKESEKLKSLIPTLSAVEEIELNNMINRLTDIAEHAIDKGVPVMIDAEQSYVQPAISKITLDLMRKYNRKTGHILNTYQSYLRATYDVMECDMLLARKEGWHFGLKLVRGAYMNLERNRATALGYPDPINPDFESTSEMYHACLRRIVEEHKTREKGSVSVMVASHNEDTIRYAVNLMKDHGIAPSEKTITFAQLYGMCDQVTFPLGQAGYPAYKYLPYGPIEKVLPYLSRRAVENSSILSKANKEQGLMRAELKRRLLSGQVFYSVPS